MASTPVDSTVDVDEDDVLPAFAAVLSGSTGDDCATLEVFSGRGDFSIEFVPGADPDPAAWNVASDPPQTRVKGYEEVDRGPNYVTLYADATTPEEALVELRDIVGQVGGKAAEVELKETKTIRTPTIHKIVRLLGKQFRELLSRGGRA